MQAPKRRMPTCICSSSGSESTKRAMMNSLSQSTANSSTRTQEEKSSTSQMRKPSDDCGMRISDCGFEEQKAEGRKQKAVKTALRTAYCFAAFSHYQFAIRIPHSAIIKLG